jgi:hypothetical protein
VADRSADCLCLKLIIVSALSLTILDQHLFLMPPYRRLQQYAIVISIINILYNGAEATVSVGLGSDPSSRSLVFFGVQSCIEVISTGIVVWRFKKIAKPGEENGAILSARELRYVHSST